MTCASVSVVDGEFPVSVLQPHAQIVIRQVDTMAGRPGIAISVAADNLSSCAAVNRKFPVIAYIQVIERAVSDRRELSVSDGRAEVFASVDSVVSGGVIAAALLL